MIGITALQQYYYQIKPDDEGLYHCPYVPGCSHVPTKLKSTYHQYLNSHMKPFRCEEQTCNGVQFSYKGDYQRHKDEIHGEEKLCPYSNCNRSIQGQGFKRRDNLKRHIKLVHIKTNEKLRRAQSCQGNSEARKAERKVSELEKKNAEMGALVDGQLERIVHTQQKNERLQQENETLQQENETLQQENETLQQENETLQQENETLQQENETLQQENETLQQENETLQQENETLQQENETLQRGNGTLQQENFALQLWYSQYIEILNSANTTVSTQNWNLDRQISQVSAIQPDQSCPFEGIDFPGSDCEPHFMVPNSVLQVSLE
ncbi:hypothetical protein K469DRAFT_686024 [Zopfia rhizophila CBS 207.26]|uniref:C2H2-type domain-containing protein n=1 Tax=Zopfia rhizophila CBS 207.26 TaxID=1314779 RepID=A0A6A6D6A0_9PEZI|nr:hypothetical protein K469DRAFT_686024 [Zopfia rhizophila CBS 207.26]